MHLRLNWPAIGQIWKSMTHLKAFSHESTHEFRKVQAEPSFSGRESTPAARKLEAADTTAFWASWPLITPAPLAECGKRLQCLGTAEWRRCTLANWDYYWTPSVRWNIDEGEELFGTQCWVKQHQSSTAPALLNRNDTHRSHFFVYVMVGADYKKQLDLRSFFPRSTICIYYQWQSKGINIMKRRSRITASWLCAATNQSSWSWGSNYVNRSATTL